MTEVNNPDISSPEEEAQLKELEKKLKAEKAVTGTRKGISATTKPETS